MVVCAIEYFQPYAFIYFEFDLFQATGSWDKTVQVWTMNKKIECNNIVLYGHTSNVKSLVFSSKKLLVNCLVYCVISVMFDQ